MSKESREHGLGRVYFSYASGAGWAKRDEPVRPGRFYPEARDDARLLPRLRDGGRRT